MADKHRFIPQSDDVLHLILGEDTMQFTPNRSAYSMVRVEKGGVRRQRRGEYAVGRIYLLRKKGG